MKRMDITLSSFTVPPEQELRIETEPGGSPVTVLLRSGHAEIFGAQNSLARRLS